MRYALLILFVFLSSLGFSQVVGTNEYRVPDENTAFGRGVPIGAKIYDTTKREYWVINTEEGAGPTKTLATTENKHLISSETLISDLTINFTNQRIYGDVIWIEDLDFHVTECGYYIQGERYTSTPADLTLTAADPALSRIDVFYVDTNGVAGYLTGTPSADPAKPLVDPLSQLELTDVLIGAGATTPGGVSNEVIYDENVEWVSSTANLGVNTIVDFDYTVAPQKNSKNTRIYNNIGGKISGQVIWTGSSDFSPNDDIKLVFWIKTSEDWKANSTMAIMGMKDGIYSFGIKMQRYTFPSFDHTSREWQRIVMDISQLPQPSNNPQVFNQVNFTFDDTWTNGTEIYLDNIYLQTGLDQPSPEFSKFYANYYAVAPFNDGWIYDQDTLNIPVPSYVPIIVVYNWEEFKDAVATLGAAGGGTVWLGDEIFMTEDYTWTVEGVTVWGNSNSWETPFNMGSYSIYVDNGVPKFESTRIIGNRTDPTSTGRTYFYIQGNDATNNLTFIGCHFKDFTGVHTYNVASTYEIQINPEGQYHYYLNFQGSWSTTSGAWGTNGSGMAVFVEDNNAAEITFNLYNGPNYWGDSGAGMGRDDFYIDYEDLGTPGPNKLRTDATYDLTVTPIGTPTYSFDYQVFPQFNAFIDYRPKETDLSGNERLLLATDGIDSTLHYATAQEIADLANANLSELEDIGDYIGVTLTPLAFWTDFAPSQFNIDMTGYTPDSDFPAGTQIYIYGTNITSPSYLTITSWELTGGNWYYCYFTGTVNTGQTDLTFNNGGGDILELPYVTGSKKWHLRESSRTNKSTPPPNSIDLIFGGDQTPDRDYQVLADNIRVRHGIDMDTSYITDATHIQAHRYTNGFDIVSMNDNSYPGAYGYYTIEDSTFLIGMHFYPDDSVWLLNSPTNPDTLIKVYWFPLYDVENIQPGFDNPYPNDPTFRFYGKWYPPSYDYEQIGFTNARPPNEGDIVLMEQTRDQSQNWLRIVFYDPNAEIYDQLYNGQSITLHYGDATNQSTTVDYTYFSPSNDGYATILYTPYFQYYMNWVHSITIPDLEPLSVDLQNEYDLFSSETERIYRITIDSTLRVNSSIELIKATEPLHKQVGEFYTSKDDSLIRAWNGKTWDILNNIAGYGNILDGTKLGQTTIWNDVSEQWEPSNYVRVANDSIIFENKGQNNHIYGTFQNGMFKAWAQYQDNEPGQIFFLNESGFHVDSKETVSAPGYVSDFDVYNYFNLKTELDGSSLEGPYEKGRIYFDKDLMYQGVSHAPYDALYEDFEWDSTNITMTPTQIDISAYNSTLSGYPGKVINSTWQSIRIDKDSITAPYLNVDEIVDDKSLVTKEFVVTYVGETPLMYVTNWTEFKAAMTYLDGIGGGIIWLAGVITMTEDYHWTAANVKVLGSNDYINSPIVMGNYAFYLEVSRAEFEKVAFLGTRTNPATTGQTYFYLNYNQSLSVFVFTSCHFKDMVGTHIKDDASTYEIQISPSSHQSYYLNLSATWSTTTGTYAESAGISIYKNDYTVRDLSISISGGVGYDATAGRDNVFINYEESCDTYDFKIRGEGVKDIFIDTIGTPTYLHKVYNKVDFNSFITWRDEATLATSDRLLVATSESDSVMRQTSIQDILDLTDGMPTGSQGQSMFYQSGSWQAYDRVRIETGYPAHTWLRGINSAGLKIYYPSSTQTYSELKSTNSSNSHIAYYDHNFDSISFRIYEGFVSAAGLNITPSGGIKAWNYPISKITDSTNLTTVAYVDNAISTATQAVWEQEVANDSDNNWTVSFTIASTAIITYNGQRLEDSDWSGEGTTTLALAFPTYKYDQIIVQNN